MATGMEFPIGFDLQSGIQKADKEAEVFLRRLQKTLGDKPLTFSLVFNKGDFDYFDNQFNASMKAIKDNMKDLEKRWNEMPIYDKFIKGTDQLEAKARSIVQEFNQETVALETYGQKLSQVAAKVKKAAEADQKAKEKKMEFISKVRAEETTINAITQKLKIYQAELNKTDMGSAKFERVAAEVKRLQTALEQAKAKVAELTNTAVVKHKQHEDAVRKANQEYRAQSTYVERLIKRMAVYASAAMVGQFLSKVREVTAQFELQRVSLGAIIQDQQKANQLFSDIKSFALKSPLKIMDLVTYTKQVAAYRIETDKLFDTTKRLADVSVGLGVDMQRIVLAYGQVKAASYLRAAEIRQFTEAGIPLLALLADKFSELEGHAVSTEEVMDKVSKRMVSFGMVEDIFKDMTDAGGIFYNMQEKQSETLYGMWAKLGDAASIMYNEIGNTAPVYNAMKTYIEWVQSAMKHWTAFASVISTSVTGFALYKAAVAGLIPYYKLHNQQILNNIKNQKLKKATDAEILSIGRNQTRMEQYLIASKKKLRAADYEQYLTETKLSASKKLLLARQAANNQQLRIALLRTKTFTNAQIQQLASMSKIGLQWQIFTIRIKNATTALLNFMKVYWPLAALTAGIQLVSGWIDHLQESHRANEKVAKDYEEMRQKLELIEGAWDKAKRAAQGATESTEEFAASSFDAKLEQLKEIIKLLDKFGLKNQIDLSVMNTENIDQTIDAWLKKLNEANELSKSWGGALADVATAYEGNIGAWSIFGENLTEDMKDLSRSWNKLVVNKDFNRDLTKMRADIEAMEGKSPKVYENISKAIGMDAKLALSQRKRNESELQYQQRIWDYYEKIRQAVISKNYGAAMGPYVSLDLSSLNKDMDEVMHEFEKTLGGFQGKDGTTIRMAIDEQWALNEWEEWQKDWLIQKINETHPEIELIPTLSSSGVGQVIEGLKAIISTEFPQLFTENDLKSLVSVDSIVEAIDGKLEAATKKVKAATILQNNVVYGSKEYQNTVTKISQLQDEITEITSKQLRYEELKNNEANLTKEQQKEMQELGLELKNIDESIVKTKQAQITALINANAEYDKQIENAKAVAKAEYEAAKAAKERVTQMGFSSLAKDVKGAFGGLMVDEYQAATDNNYMSRYLFTDDDLANIRDAVDLYDKWATKYKAALDDKKKLEDVGISEVTIAKERAALDEKLSKTQLDLADTERQMESSSWSQVNAKYEAAKVELAQATTEAQRKAAQEKINTILGDTKNKEFAILALKKQSLKYTLAEQLTAQEAQDQIAANLEGIDDAIASLEDYAKRYNLHLPDTTKKGGSGEDPWIILMKNRSSFMKDFQAGVENLNKSMQRNMALGNEQDIMLYRGASLGIDVKTLDGTRKELVDWYDDAIAEVKKRIYGMGGKLWEGLGVQAILAKDTKSRMIKKYQELLQELFNAQTDFQTAKLQKDMEEKLKQLADAVSRSEAAQDFFDKIFTQTGDYDLSVGVTMSVYGQSGEDLQKNIIKQIEEVFKSSDEGVKIDLSSAINYDTLDVDYTELMRIYEDCEDSILEKNRATAKKIAEQGVANYAKQVETWQKELGAAKDFEQQKLEIIDKYTKKRADIIKSNLPSDVKDQYIAQSYKNQSADLMGVSEAEFKASDDYAKIFQDLDRISTPALQRLKAKLQEVIDANKDLDPKNMKEFVNALEKLTAEEETRNPLKGITSSVREYFAARAEVSAAQANLAKEEAVWLETKSGYEAEITAAKQEQELAQQNIDELEAAGLSGTAQMVSAQQQLNAATAKVAKAEEKKAKAEKKVQDAAKGVTDKMDDSKKASSKFQKNLEAISSESSSAADALEKVAEALGIADDSTLGEIISGAVEGLQTMSSILVAILALSVAIEASMWWLLAIGAAVGILANIGNIFSASKVKKANKEIEKQQKLLDQLEYAYERLENAQDSAFGANYITNYKAELKNLKAQQTAYLKQAEAERSKGKKADKDKIQEYEEAARDVADEIADMQSQIAEQMLGTDLTSAAQDFAQAWIDAYKEFSNTTDAMKEKFQDLIESMVANNVIAAVMEKALQPTFDLINSMSESDFYNKSFWEQVVAEAEKGAAAGAEGAETVMKFLESAGINLRDTSSDLTGISRDIATASEESINGLAAGINTQNFYIAQIYTYVRQIAEGNTASVSGAESGSIADLIAIQNEHLAYLPTIAANTAATVERCERAAVACEDFAYQIKKVISAKGTKSGYVLNTQLQ